MKTEILNSLGRDFSNYIVEIINPVNKETFYYLTGDFRPADATIQYHHLSNCYDISDKINNATDITQVSVLLKNVDLDRIRVNKKFSREFIWVWHL